MTTPATQPNQQLTVKGLFNSESVKAKFNELLGKKAQGFITSVLQIATNNKLLLEADPMSLYNAAATAASMDLPINQNLGFAWIVPYKGQAQFQMGWRGYVQLAQRSGQFKTINSIEVYENQIEKIDYLTGEITLKQDEPSGKVIGFIAYFRLVNGFEKSLYMSKKQMDIHAKKYSQTYKKNFGVWADGEDGFNAMGKKTVLKLLLSKFAPLSIEMQKAVIVDQAIINDENADTITYIDNAEPDKELERMAALIDNAASIKELESYKKDLPESLQMDYACRMQELKEIADAK